MVKSQPQEETFRDQAELERAYRELSAELKKSQREIREQSLKLRDYRDDNSKLREALRQVRSELAEDPRKFSKSERNQYREHIQSQDNYMAWMSHELDKREAHIEMLTRQTRDANKERDEHESHGRKLQRQIKELQESLTECKDDLLRLQPNSQVSDSEIGDQFSNLCQQITSWVDDQTEDTDALEDRFEKIKTVEALNMDPILGLYLNEDHVRLIQDVPDALPMVVQYLIHCCLEQYVLGNGIYFYGLDIRNIGLLKEVEQGMRLLEPARGR